MTYGAIIVKLCYVNARGEVQKSIPNTS
jgi:hypothetical protein